MEYVEVKKDVAYTFHRIKNYSYLTETTHTTEVVPDNTLLRTHLRLALFGVKYKLRYRMCFARNPWKEFVQVAP